MRDAAVARGLPAEAIICLANSTIEGTETLMKNRQTAVILATGGTGTAAQIPGVPVAGKTGTAETGNTGINTAWFICFAPANHPRYAVAVVLQNQIGVGGAKAAPIAKLVLESLLKGG